MRAFVRRPLNRYRLHASRMTLRIFALLAVMLFLTQPAEAQDPDELSGCGPTRDRAMEELAKTIFSNIRSSYKESRRLHGDDETLNIRDELYVSTQLDLYNVDIREQGNKICAYQSKRQLQNSYNEALTYVIDSCNPDEFGDKGSGLEKHIVRCREKALLVDTLNPLFYKPDQERRSRMKKLRAWLIQFETIVASILHQSVKFTLTPSHPDARVVIDHTPRSIAEAIPLSAGEISYEFQIKDYCPIRGTFKLRSGSPNKKSRHRVTVNLKKFEYPRVIFKTETQNATLKVDGTMTELSRTIEYKQQCSGRLPYVLLTSTGQKVEDSVALVPGETVTENIVVPDRDFLQKVTEQWENRNAILFRYGGGVPLSGEIGTDWVQTVQAEYLTVFHPIRLGVGVLYGNGGAREHIFEAYGRVAAQLTRVGDLPIHIGSQLAFVPFLGFDVGLGYSGLVPRNTGKRGDFGSTAESIIVFRGVAGTSLALNQVFNLMAEVHWEFVTRGQRLGLSVGLGFLF